MRIGLTSGVLIAWTACAAVRQPAPDDRVEWLRAHAQPIAIAPKTPDTFQDLLPLKRAIGESSMVMLGELTHGDGTGFEAKVRLVRFLHQEMGFGVLVWESGLYDCEMMDRELAGTKPLERVAVTGVFGHWSSGVESFPVFEYARETQGTSRPLRMAGFDIQTSGLAGNSQYPDFLDWLSTPAVIARELKATLTDAFAAAREIGKAADPGAEYQRIDHLLREKAPDLLRALEEHRGEIVASVGEREYAFRRKCLHNAVEYARMMDAAERHQQTKSGADFITGYNLRERANAENLVWLAAERYPDQKLIVWAHNSHLFGGIPTTGSTDAEDPADAVTNDDGVMTNLLNATGRLVKRRLGDRVYSIGFIAHSGAWSWLGNPAINYEPAESGSIEDLFHQAGRPTAFLDLRQVREDGSHWLNRPLRGHINQQQPEIIGTVWPRAFDGVVFVDAMSPRTQKK